VLARAGYSRPPPSTQFFALEEETIAPGDRVFVVGEDDGAGRVHGRDGAPLVVSNLTRGRVILREAWGPALAGLFAALIFATGATVFGTWLWLR
jgi:hypothetical protein